MSLSFTKNNNNNYYTANVYIKMYIIMELYNTYYVD